MSVQKNLETLERSLRNYPQGFNPADFESCIDHGIDGVWEPMEEEDVREVATALRNILEEREFPAKEKKVLRKRMAEIYRENIVGLYARVPDFENELVAFASSTGPETAGKILEKLMEIGEETLDFRYTELAYKCAVSSCARPDAKEKLAERIVSYLKSEDEGYMLRKYREFLEGLGRAAEEPLRAYVEGPKPPEWYAENMKIARKLLERIVGGDGNG